MLAVTTLCSGQLVSNKSLNKYFLLNLTYPNHTLLIKSSYIKQIHFDNEMAIVSLNDKKLNLL